MTVLLSHPRHRTSEPVDLAKCCSDCPNITFNLLRISTRVVSFWGPRRLYAWIFYACESRVDRRTSSCSYGEDSGHALTSPLSLSMSAVVTTLPSLNDSLTLLALSLVMISVWSSGSRGVGVWLLASAASESLTLLDDSVASPLSTRSALNLNDFLVALRQSSMRIGSGPAASHRVTLMLLPYVVNLERSGIRSSTSR